MVDTGHGRSINSGRNQLPSPNSTHHHPAASLRRSRSASGPAGCGKRSAVVRGCPQSDSGSQPVDLDDVSGPVSYVMDVKRALASQPGVYRQFVEILQRYHHRRREAQIPLCRLPRDDSRQVREKPATSPLVQIPLRRLPRNFPVRSSFGGIDVMEFGLKASLHVSAAAAASSSHNPP